LQAICDLDLSDLGVIEPPRGFGGTESSKYQPQPLLCGLDGDRKLNPSIAATPQLDAAAVLLNHVLEMLWGRRRGDGTIVAAT
jgi:hypothetical protein